MAHQKSFEILIEKALAVLKEVRQKLLEGVNKTEFINEYHGKFVSPGVTVSQFVHQLRLSGDLEETETTMKLRREDQILVVKSRENQNSN